jgi:transcriptional regulator with XRE-family HTH domain
MKTFGQWLKDELSARGMKAADLTRATNGRLQSGVISNFTREKRSNPEHETCQLIAQAFNIPVEEVYRAAGYLPPVNGSNPTIEQVAHIMRGLDETNQQEILAYAILRESIARRRN